MAEPFSTNELFLRSDRIAFGKIPPEVPQLTEQTLILPDLTGSKLYFGLSSLVSTSGFSGTLEAIYPNYASFTFDNLNSRLGINISTPQYAIDISTTTGVRIQGGSLIANATGLVSVPTASLFSTLPSYVFAPGTIPVTAIASTGGSVLPGISVPTSALFSTLPTSVFAPSSIPLVALQSSGIIVASSFVGSGFYLSNIPLANINGTITGDFFRPNSIPLSTLASTGQIWIRNPEGSIFVPYLSTAQILTSSLVARDVSTINLTTNRFLASSIQANYFESVTFAASNISAINIKASSLDVLCRVSAGTFYGDGQNITNLTPAFLNNVIPSDKFGYRLIGINAINPYGNWQWIAGTFTLQQAAPLVSLGDIRASSFTGGVFSGDGRGLYNLNAISTASLASTVRGLGTVGYVSSLSLTSSLVGLGSINYVSTASLVSTVIGLSHSGYVSSTQVVSTIEGLGTLGYVSSTQLTSTVRGLATSGYISSTQLNSTLTGLATLGFVSSTQVASTVEGLASAGYISSTQLNSTLQGLSQIGYVSTTQLTSTVFSLETQNYSTSAGNTKELVSSLSGLGSLGYISTSQLNSTLTGLASLGFLSTTQLTSTVFSLETQNYSTSAGNTGELLSSLTGLGSLGYISTSQLNSTLTGLASLGYVSTTQLTSTVISLETQNYSTSAGNTAELLSSLTGLGSLGYISSTQLNSTLQGLSQIGYVSTTQLVSTVTSLQNQNNSTSAGNTSELLSSLTGLGSLGYISSAQLVSTVGGLEFYISTFIDPTELTSSIVSTVIGLGINQKLTSTVEGLGSAGYLSSISLVSTTSALLTSSFQSFLSTVEGLGSAGYVSTVSLTSTTSALQTYSFQSFLSTVEGLGSAGYVSTVSLTSTTSALQTSSLQSFLSTVEGLGSAGYVSTLSLVSTTLALQTYISSFIDPTELASTITSTVLGIGLEPNLKSTVTGLGSAGYVSTLSLVSTTYGLQTSGFLSSPNLLSTVGGLGSAGYVSTLSLVSTTYGLQTSGFLSSLNLLSTTEGLGSAGYVSTLSLVSTTLGLQTYISSFIDPTELASTILSTVVGIGIQSNLTSTVTGLGSAGYVSSLSLVSTTFGLQQYISSFIDPTELASSILPFISSTYFTTSLTSTVTGLGSAGYVSTLSMYSAINTAISSLSSAYGFVGSLATIPSTLSTFSLLTSSLTASTIQTRTISSLDLWVSSINGAAPGSGSLTSIPSTLSTFAILTSSLTTSTLTAKIERSESSITSTLVINGTGIAKWNGTNSASLYGSGVDTFTLQTSCNAYQGGIASLAFGVSNTGYPLGRIYALDSAASGSPISQLIFQTVPISATTFNSNYAYTGSGQTFTVPTGVTTIQVTLWGAGGGGNGAGKYGGAGAFVQGTLNVSPGQVYTIVVGQGGPWGTTSPAYGGGAASGGGGYSQGSGGGRSAIQRVLSSIISSASGSGGSITYNTSSAHGLVINQPVIISGLSPSGFNGTYIVTATPSSTQFLVASGQTGSSSGTGSILAEVVNVGGGGGGSVSYGGGYAAFSGTSAAGGGVGGGGGTQTSGGIAGGGSPFPGDNGTLLQGGNGYYNSGAGGGGYYGGGGGGGGSSGAGGGGSSYTNHTSFTLLIGQNSPNLQEQAPGTSVGGYVAGVAVGGTSGVGGNGYVILNSIGGSITEAMRIGSNSYVGIGTTAPSYPLDVAGNARMSNIYLGTNSTLITQQFYGLFGNYNNTVLAEISTGGGSQELLVFRGSSASDRVRVQTTGAFVVETGVSARLWSTNTAVTASNVTPAFIINTSSNVGIQTANPGATLDVAGTGRFQVVSTQQVFASTLQVPYISSLSLWVSSINGALPGSGSLTSLPSTISTFSLLTSSLTASTITAPYISGLALWISSINGALPGSGSLTSLPSTISTFSLLTSSIQASTISTIFLIASTITTSNINASTGLISSFSTNTINFAGGFGYLTMPDIYPNTVYTSTLTASNLLVGINSNVSPIQFYGFGTYSNSVIAELSTGGTTQELFFFRGSNASDRMRFQTTGSVVFEPGVSARIWPTVPSNVTPAMIINTSSNIGIQNAAPTVPLDVTGQIRATSFSTQQIATSSIINNPYIAGAVITSSFFMLGPSTFQVGAFSTSFMTAGPQQTDFFTNASRRLTILSNGFVGIGTANPAYLLDVAGTTRLSTVFLSSATAFNNLSTVLLQTSSFVGNNVQGNILSSVAMGASTFTGKWNDAQYYVLQTI